MNKKKKKMIDYGRYGYFFIAPFFITYLVFQLWPRWRAQPWLGGSYQQRPFALTRRMGTFLRFVSLMDLALRRRLTGLLRVSHGDLRLT